MEFMYLVACEQALHLGESREVKRVPLVSRRSLHSLAINGELAGRLCISMEFNEMIVRERPDLVFL